VSRIEQFLGRINELVWGVPLTASILCIGVYFTCRLKIFEMPKLKMLFSAISAGEEEYGDISVFASLCTALSATIGVGNIVGIAVAITLGGPGTLFWLWISSIFSLSIKYSEGLLSIKYRAIGNDGKMSGGPMYYIGIGLYGKKFAQTLSKLFSFFGIITAIIGIGTVTQSDSIAVAMETFGISTAFASAIVTICTAVIVCGGLKRIASTAELLTPSVIVFHIVLSMIVLAMNYELIPEVFKVVFEEAFAPGSFIGGGAGITIQKIASVGIVRGIYSHESGLGSSAIASAAGRTRSPCTQGLVSMFSAVVSIVVCTITSFVIIITCRETHIFSQDRSVEALQLVESAFGFGLGFERSGKYIIDAEIIFLAFTTIIGWYYYGEKCTQYLFNDKTIIFYRILFVFFIAIGPFYGIEELFMLGDILMAFMAMSNLIGIVRLRKTIIDETKNFFSSRAK
jgi:AGCS family alanine or glycine:cation symporter